MKNLVRIVDSLLNDLNEIQGLRERLSWRLDNSDDKSIDELIKRFEFFSLKIATVLEQNHNDAQNKINELEKISYVPDFHDPHLDFSSHFFTVGEMYRNFLRSLKYEKSSKKSTQVLSDTKLHPVQQQVKIRKKVFIVHGHDNALKNEVARFIENQNIKAIILHEQINHGSITIIEKIESYSDVGFAIVLYTPCDLGKSAKDPDGGVKHRARQNVVFEHGYFTAKLGRNRVSALTKGSLELPNDISGVVYEAYDEAGAWKFKLGKELAAAGYDIDFANI